MIQQRLPMAAKTTEWKVLGNRIDTLSQSITHRLLTNYKVDKVPLQRRHMGTTTKTKHSDLVDGTGIITLETIRNTYHLWNIAKNVQSESDHEKKIQREMWQVHSTDKVAWTLKKKKMGKTVRTMTI